MRRRASIAAAAAAFAIVALAGCAIRYDRAGVSRVGIFLWGFGDPPGVNWNLDRPRREAPDLPPAPRRDPPSAFDPLRAPVADFDTSETLPRTGDMPIPPIDDNRDCAPRCMPAPTPPVARRADDRAGVAFRR